MIAIYGYEHGISCSSANEDFKTAGAATITIKMCLKRNTYMYPHRY